MSEKRHRPHKSRSRHSLCQEARNHRDLIKLLQQGVASTIRSRRGTCDHCAYSFGAEALLCL